MKKKTEPKKRIEYIDIARCLAMFCIIIGHLGDPKIDNFVFTFHIPLFLFVSGYFFKPEQDFKSFIKHKYKTLIKPYIVVCIIICVTKTILSTSGNPLYDLFYWGFASFYGSGAPRNYSNLIFPKIGAIWFLLALFFALITFKVLLKLPKFIRLILIIAIVQLSIYSAKFFWLPFSLQSAGCFIIFIYIGYLIKKYEHLIKFNRFTIFSSIILIAIWIYCLYNGCGLYLVNAHIKHGIIDILGSMGGCIALILLSKQIYNFQNPFSKEFENLGKNSIYILCIHLLELTLMLDILYPFLGNKMYNELFASLILINRICFPFIITLFIIYRKQIKEKIKSTSK